MSNNLSTGSFLAGIRWWCEGGATGITVEPTGERPTAAPVAEDRTSAAEEPALVSVTDVHAVVSEELTSVPEQPVPAQECAAISEIPAAAVEEHSPALDDPVPAPEVAPVTGGARPEPTAAVGGEEAVSDGPRDASPTIRSGSPPIRAGSPPIRSGSPPITSGSPPVRSASPPIVLCVPVAELAAGEYI